MPLAAAEKVPTCLTLSERGRGAKECPNGFGIEEIMAQPAFPTVTPPDQHRHQLVIQFDQGRIGIDIDYLYGEGKFILQGLQRYQHVIAQVTIRARI